MWHILSDVPHIATVSVLNEITNNKQFQVRHNNIKGYIRYCNNYYIFQPNIYEDLSIPLAIRSAQFLLNAMNIYLLHMKCLKMLKNRK